MNDEFNKRISEVLNILEHSEDGIREKIPARFVKLLQDNKAENYVVNINYADEEWINKLPNDTKGLLALIYRDYIADEEERNELIAQEKEIELRKANKKYNPKDMFKEERDQRTVNERLREEAIQEVQNALMVIQEEKWYERIINRIKLFFGIRHK